MSLSSNNCFEGMSAREVVDVIQAAAETVQKPVNAKFTPVIHLIREQIGHLSQASSLPYHAEMGTEMGAFLAVRNWMSAETATAVFTLLQLPAEKLEAYGVSMVA